jgi:hypothetical protein
MTRDKLVGTWKCRQTNIVRELRPDGFGISRITRPDGRMHGSRLEWSLIDPVHWRMGVYIDPVPHIPGLENGTIQEIVYEIIAEDESTMSLVEFDVEFAWVWERQASNPTNSSIPQT